MKCCELWKASFRRLLPVSGGVPHPAYHADWCTGEDWHCSIGVASKAMAAEIETY